MNEYFHTQSQFPTLQQDQYEQLHPRDRYLLAHKGLAYIDLVETDHEVRYQRNPHYLARIFAPYFPEAERVFMQELAEQNQQANFQQQTFHLHAEEILARAQFWDKYLPNTPLATLLKMLIFSSSSMPIYCLKACRKTMSRSDIRIAMI